MSHRASEAGHAAPRDARVYTNAVLTVIAAALVMLAAHATVGLPGPAEARAERQMGARSVEPAAQGLPNAADQRLRMIAALERMDERLAKIEGKLSGRAIEVKVVEMPEIKISQ